MADLIEELVEAGVHYGHQSRKWNPKMKSFLLQKRSGVHIINVEETALRLEEASDFLSKLVLEGGKVLFVGCKRQAQEAVRQAAEACGQYYVNHRWLGGMMTNLSTIRKSVDRLEYLEGLENSVEKKLMSKSELASLNREREKLLRNLRGVRNMRELPQAVVIVDSAREHIAVNESRRLNIPVVAMIDSNADPTHIKYPIPANDDAIRSIRIVLQNLIDPVIAATDGGKLVKKKRPDIDAA
jgi:small subunit ribosomal protein S2